MGIGTFLAGGGAVMRGVNQGNDEQDARDFAARVRATGVRRMDAEDGLMPAETAAKSAALGLQTDAALAARGALPARTRLESTQTAIAQKTGDHTLGHLGAMFDIKDTELAAALNKAKVGLDQSKFELESLPRLISKAKTNNAIDDVKTADMLLGGLGHALTMGDKGVVMRYIQAGLDGSMDAANKGRKVADAGTIEGPDGKPVFVAKDEAGAIIMAVPGSRITDAYSRINPAEYKTLADGGSLVKVQGGKVTVVAENTKDFKPADQIARTAAEQKNLDMRMSRGKGILDSTFKANTLNGLLPETEAQYMRATARMGELVRGGADPEAAAKQAYDEVKDADKRGKATGGAAGAAPAGGKATFTPWK